MTCPSQVPFKEDQKKIRLLSVIELSNSHSSHEISKFYKRFFLHDDYILH